MELSWLNLLTYNIIGVPYFALPVWRYRVVDGNNLQNGRKGSEHSNDLLIPYCAYLM